MYRDTGRPGERWRDENEQEEEEEEEVRHRILSVFVPKRKKKTLFKVKTSQLAEPQPAN